MSVCAVDLAGMRVAGMPGAFAFDNLEMLYRLGVRLPSGEPTFLTLRSDVSARPLAVSGKWFSHYRPRHASLHCRKTSGRWRLGCKSKDGRADAELIADISSPSDRSDESLFPDARSATEFLLGMKGSAAAGKLGIRTQRIEHAEWAPRFVTLERRRFDHLDRLGEYLGRELVYDSTLYVSGVAHRWCAASMSGELR